MTRYLKALLLAFAAVWLWAAINPTDRHDWLLENYLVFMSYTLIMLFMILHVIGGLRTQANNPLT